MADDLLRVFVSLFIIVDPVGNVLVFHLLTRSLSPSRRGWVVAVAVVAAGMLLTVFSLGGHDVLAFLGISSESFSVAAGLLLLLPAYRLVAYGHPMELPDDNQEATDAVAMGLVPMATPLLAGPGALAATVSFTETVGLVTTITAIVMVLALCALGFAGASWLFRALGPSLLRLLSWLVGIALFAIATDFILDGLAAALR